MINIQKYLSKLEEQERDFIQSLMQEMTDEQTQKFVTDYRKRRKSPSLILFTALLGFIGLAGINRFIVGQTVLGVIYLLTLGIYWIGTIFDCLTYKKIALKYNKEQAQAIANEIQDSPDLQENYFEEAQRRKEIFDTYDTMVNQLLDQFQASVWPSGKCHEGRTVHFSEQSIGSKPYQYAWKGWFVGKLEDGLLRYFYGILIVLEDEIGNPNPIFAVCHSEDGAPKAIITNNTLKGELSSALELAATKPPIDLSEIKEIVDDQLRMAILMNLAIGQLKVKYVEQVIAAANRALDEAEKKQ